MNFFFEFFVVVVVSFFVCVVVVVSGEKNVYMARLFWGVMSPVRKKINVKKPLVFLMNCIN